MYADPNTPKDAEGFMTVTIPLSTPHFSQRGYYYAYGNNPFRDANTVAGGGRVDGDPNTAGNQWADATDGFDPLSFGGPLSSISVPQGVPVLGIGIFI